MKTINVGIVETIFREVKVDISDEFYSNLLKDPYRTDLSNLEDCCLSKIEKGEFHDEDYEDKIAYIIGTGNGNVKILYD